jgi:pimeloyl-ACP methyl ester carboxylesterase
MTQDNVWMIADFLPAAAAQLTEATSIAVAQQISQVPLQTDLSPAEIATTFISQETGPSQSVGAAPQSLATPILLLHGFDSSLFEFRRLIPQLVQSESWSNPRPRKIWAMDLLGFGFTERRADLPFTPAAIKSHLYAFWQTQIQQPMILVGASMGGAAAIDFALTYPQAVARLILLDSAGYRRSPALGKFLVPPLGTLATAFLRRPQVRQQVSRNAYCDPSFVTADAELCAALHLESPRWSEALVAFTRSSGYVFLGPQQVSKIACPTLILWGDRDRILGTTDAEPFQRAIAQSQLIWIPDCGHVPHLEKPHLTAQHILSFAHTNDE